MHISFFKKVLINFRWSTKHVIFGILWIGGAARISLRAPLKCCCLLNAVNSNLQVAAKCKELGAQSAHYIALDMGKSADTRQLVEETKNTLHSLDQLILNHVTYDHMGLWDGDVERLTRVMKVNFESYVRLASLATPLLEESSGSIGVVSSGAGEN